MKTTCVVLLSLLAPSAAFVAPQAARTSTALSAQASRAEFLRDITAAAGVAVAGSVLNFGAVFPASAAEGDVTTTDSGVTVKVIKAGTGPEPDYGELAAVRFAAYNGEIKIDDIFDTPEPYYTRVGMGGLIKGVEEVLPKMRVGDRWLLTIPGNLAFGPKGRPSSAGKPRIQANAEIVFDIEMVGLPGKEPELIELIGDD